MIMDSSRLSIVNVNYDKVLPAATLARHFILNSHTKDPNKFLVVGTCINDWILT